MSHLPTAPDRLLSDFVSSLSTSFFLAIEGDTCVPNEPKNGWPELALVATAYASISLSRSTDQEVPRVLAPVVANDLALLVRNRLGPRCMNKGVGC